MFPFTLILLVPLAYLRSAFVGVYAGIGSNVNVLSPPSTNLNFGLGVTVTFLGVGYEHNCVILSIGGLHCWGDNRYGQLGESHR